MTQHLTVIVGLFTVLIIFEPTDMWVSFHISVVNAFNALQLYGLQRVGNWSQVLWTKLSSSDNSHFGSRPVVVQ